MSACVIIVAEKVNSPPWTAIQTLKENELSLDSGQVFERVYKCHSSPGLKTEVNSNTSILPTYPLDVGKLFNKHLGNMMQS